MIFCVEDEQNICGLEVYTLQSVGMEAQGCGSGRELFALLEKQVPELIVLDIMLPDEDGVSILRRLRADKRYSNIPVIMATAKGSEFDTVFMAGLQEGVFPSKISLANESLDEEARLFYVGITRARQRLYLTAAIERGSVPCRFINAIPDEFLDREP